MDVGGGCGGFLNELDAVPVLVDEDVYIAIAEITVKDVGHYAAKIMITLSHVGRLIVRQIPNTVVQAKHGRWTP